MKMNKFEGFDFENFKPCLRRGRLIPSGNKVIFETEEPFNQIILPMNLADLVTLCTGKFTIREIITKIYKKQKNVHFKSVYQTIVLFKERNFLENGDELKAELNPLSSQASGSFVLFRSIFNLSLAKRVINDGVYSSLLWPISLAVVIGSFFFIFSLSANVFSTKFLWIRSSFFAGFSFVFIACSVLYSLQALLKLALLVAKTGRAYNLRVRLSFFGLFLQVGNESSHLLKSFKSRFAYYLSLILSHLAFTQILTQIFDLGIYSNHLKVLAVILTLFEINPYEKSYLNAFLKSFFNDQAKSNILAVFSKISTNLCWGWSLITSIVITKLIFEDWPLIQYTLESESLLSKSSGLLISTIYLCLGFYILSTFFHLLMRNILSPLYKKIYSRLSSFRARIRTVESEDELLSKISSLPVLNWFSDEEIVKLLKESHLIRYPKRATLFQEGDASSHLFILLSGQVEMYRDLEEKKHTRKITSLRPTSVFGESCLLDDQKRMATTLTSEVSTILRISAQSLLQFINSSEYAIKMDSFKTGIMINQFFHSAPMFRNLPEEVVQMITSRGQVSIHKSGDLILRQGSVSDSFYMIIRGSVDVFINEQKVNQIQQGGFFGEIAVIGQIPRTASVQTREACVLFKLSADSFWEILTQHLEMAMFIESVGERRMKEDLELYEEIQEGKKVG